MPQIKSKTVRRYFQDATWVEEKVVGAPISIGKHVSGGLLRALFAWFWRLFSCVVDNCPFCAAA